MENNLDGTSLGYWAITATVETVHVSSTSGEWHGSRQVPTFYLHRDVQGILTEGHAVMIAKDVIDPLRQIPRDRIHVTAVKMTA